MACGLPVIATDAGDNARVVVDSKTGFIVPVGDVDTLANRLLSLLKDDVLRNCMGNAARLRVIQEFSIPTMARKTGDLYLEILRKKQVSQTNAKK